ncbi:heme exporter protein A [Idiomarina aquatica]|uniref:Heme exporter protein A n=1 Tax=Idiomarina aquatica TaxID=1327752 RepID=A0A4R6P0V0_9GAMM|nr:cytochrome c biogenesis heme-transporting ATPase CcmA [Idiomarina aquatica]TDP31284.1 heme exporter protein A [Idiomarina aquatica]
MTQFASSAVPLLHADGVSSIRSGRVLFSQLQFAVQSGEIWQITGANGAGKSTLLRMLTGLLQPSEGRIYFNGNPIEKVRDDYHQQLLYIGHKAAVKPELTALENVYWQRRLNGDTNAKNQQQSDWDVLEQLGLLGLEEEFTGLLSAGQQRRVALTRLWCSQAKLWILDEPFTSLDVEGIALLQQRFIEHLNQGGTIVMTSHQPLNDPQLPLQQLALAAPQYEMLAS